MDCEQVKENEEIVSWKRKTEGRMVSNSRRIDREREG